MYITLAEMKAALPVELTEQLLDEHGTGVGDADAWAKIAAAVTREIDGKIGMRFSLPLATVPAVIHDAAFVLAAEALYHRRGYYDAANPWTKRAQGIRGTQGQQGGQPGLLDRIASGDEPLFAAARPANAVGGVIAEPSRLASRGRLLA